jgi:2-furoyl-CoA dehydrogenase large subunit
MARALNVPGNRLRLRTPKDSGGSFGIKKGVFPYGVMMDLASHPGIYCRDRPVTGQGC